MSKSVSILNFNLSFCGNLDSKDDIHISGCNFNGNIFAENICLKSGANIKGNIYANKMLIYENVNIEGQIVANEVIILKSAKINGNIIYNNICIKVSASINGRCSCVTREEVNNIINEERNKLFDIEKNNEVNKIIETLSRTDAAKNKANFNIEKIA